jgi:SAM-dependent methyltransferase
MGTMTSVPIPSPETPPNVQGNRAYWSKYAWPEGGDEWSRPWGSTEAMWDSSIMPRLAPVLRRVAGAVKVGHIVEIACGHGRVSRYLRPLCERLTCVDIVPACVAATRVIFEGDAGVEVHETDGMRLACALDASIDLVFSWDSLVHADITVMRSYVGEARRVLRVGGAAFLHHSNLAHHASDLTGTEGAALLGGRNKTVSAELLREACLDGLVCESQELLPWNPGARWTDCISVVKRVEGGGCTGPRAATRILHRADFAAERMHALWTHWLATGMMPGHEAVSP